MIKTINLESRLGVIYEVTPVSVVFSALTAVCTKLWATPGKTNANPACTAARPAADHHPPAALAVNRRYAATITVAKAVKLV
jgi:hypothetical protein